MNRILYNWILRYAHPNWVKDARKFIGDNDTTVLPYSTAQKVLDGVDLNDIEPAHRQKLALELFNFFFAEHKGFLKRWITKKGTGKFDSFHHLVLFGDRLIMYQRPSGNLVFEEREGITLWARFVGFPSMYVWWLASRIRFMFTWDGFISTSAFFKEHDAFLKILGACAVAVIGWIIWLINY